MGVIYQEEEELGGLLKGSSVCSDMVGKTLQTSEWNLGSFPTCVCVSCEVDTHVNCSGRMLID